jgi:hypothetical protein
MAILLNEEIVVTAKTLGKLWVKSFTIKSPTPNGEIHAMAQLMPYNDSGDFSKEQTKVITISNIEVKVLDTDSNLAKAMYYMIESLKEEFAAQATSSQNE